MSYGRAPTPFTDALEPLLDQSTRALELGSGGGRIARLVALVRELVCTDISATMLEEAQANLGRHPNVTFARTKPYKLDEFGDASFDVFAHDVFMDFDANQTVALLGEARRILVDGGMCVASFITIDRPEWGARHPRTCEGRDGTSERR